MKCCGPGYASPADAVKALRETLLYTIAIYTETGIQKPDYLATVDVDPESPTCSQVITVLRCPASGTNCTTWAGMPVHHALAMPRARHRAAICT